jgi:APA family basic amino acid/polyamine antiporter
MDGDKAAVSERTESGPKALLSLPDGVFLLVGMVVGAGIFRLPSLVAGNTAGEFEFIAVWVLGGLVSLCGALVYAELAARIPETGGEYAFLNRGMGRGVGFVFAWSRMAVIQPGAVAAVAFIFGDYASELLRLGPHSPAIWATVCVVALVGLNLAGTLPSKNIQKVMEVVLIAALVLLGLVGLFSGAPAPAPAAAPSGGGSFGLAMVFVLFTYGGWNEAAYISGEVKDARRNMVRILVGGIVVVTALYLLVNIGYLAALGLAGIRDSKAVAVDVMRLVAGDAGAVLVALIVCVSAFTTINAALFTGARTNWALGRDFRIFSGLGRWREAGSTPANAHLLQGAITLALVAAASVTPDGFSAMVAYTAPVFWTFFLLTGLTLFLIRARDGKKASFHVPLYPLVPIVFCAMCAYMLYSSIDYIRNPVFGPKFGDMVLAGIAIMAAGIPLYLFARSGARGGQRR